MYSYQGTIPYIATKLTQDLSLPSNLWSGSFGFSPGATEWKIPEKITPSPHCIPSLLEENKEGNGKHRSESQEESSLTQGCQVPIILKHHTSVQGLLCRIKTSPFCPGEVDSHVLKGHQILKEEVPSVPEPIRWLRAKNAAHRRQYEGGDLTDG